MKSNQKVIFLDSCALSAFLGLNPRESNEHRAAEALVNGLKNQGYEIFIPIQALQEVLICIDDLIERNEAYNLIAKLFKIAGLYLDSTPHLIDLLDPERMNELCVNGTTRDHIRTDEQIISIALANEAMCIYSSDKDFPKIAENKITIRDYRNHPVQESFDFTVN